MAAVTMTQTMDRGTTDHPGAVADCLALTCGDAPGRIAAARRTRLMTPQPMPGAAATMACNVAYWIMADSSALRSRRSRAHAAGDCSLCRHGPRSVVAVLPVAGDAPVDPRVSLEGLAARLEAAHKEDPGNALVARELRATLLALSAADDDDGGFDVG
jgi:hypothetical protein